MERDAKVIAIPALHAANRGAAPDEGSRVAATPAPHTEASSTVRAPAPHTEGSSTVPGAEGSQVAPAPTPGVDESHAVHAPAPRAEGSIVAGAPGWSTKRKLAVVSAGGGVLGVAAGSVLGMLAQRKQHDTHALCPDPQLACDSADRANELIRSGHSFAVGADVAFGVGAAAAIAAGVLWLTGAPDAHRGIAVVPSASSGQVRITATGSF
jgi:hypothetical protein